MAGVTEGEFTGRPEVGEDDPGGEDVVILEAGELGVDRLDQPGLVDVVDVLLHQPAQGLGNRGDRLAVSAHVGQEEASDAAGGATGEVEKVAAPLGFSVGTAIDVDVQPRNTEGPVEELIARPDPHALQGRWLFLVPSHDGATIVTAGLDLRREAEPQVLI